MARIDLQLSPMRALFDADQWKRVTTNAHIDDVTWSGFTQKQRDAVHEIRRALRSDSFGTPPPSTGGASLSGGPQTAHFAGRDPLAIHTIQGTGPASPYEGQLVRTGGIVTAVDERGFFMQEPKQGLEEGSPAVFVFTAERPDVRPGDEVGVQGKVEEFRREDSPPGSSMTQLKARLAGDVQVRSRGNPLPAAVVLNSGAQLSESLEGVRVRIPDAVVVSPPNDIPKLSDLAVVANSGASAGPRTIAGGLQEPSPAVLSVRMSVDHLPEVNVGARFPGGLEGNVVERHGHYQVRVGTPGEMLASPMKRERTTLRERFPDPKHVLFVASINAENKDVHVEDVNKVQDHDKRLVDDDVGSGQLARLVDQIIDNLGSPDIVAMQEIQDNDGAELSDVVDASQTWQAIIDEIVRRGGPRYQWVDRPPVNGKEGGMPGGNIRNGFLYNPSRVKLDEPSVHRLNDPAFAGVRVPLVATFEFAHGDKTERVTLTSVHNKSKRNGGDGSTGEEMRDAEEGAINKWAKANAPKNTHEHVGAFGDRNATGREHAMKIEQQDDALKLVTDDIPAERRYSTSFGGVSDLIDHAAVKSSANVVAEIVHMNSDFDARFRASDHDGVVTAWDFRTT
jgi:predicted extracellular nuclease